MFSVQGTLTMKDLDIVERLRGKVRVPVNDGAGLLDGKDFFERSFPTSKSAMEAADEIERLRTQLEAARKALEAIGHFDDFLDKETARRMREVARAALQENQG
jgi:hypothetical protein